MIRFGPFTFNRHTAELRRQDDVIHLTTGEISLLQALAAKPGRSISRAELGTRASSRAPIVRSTCRWLACGARSRTTRASRATS